MSEAETPTSRVRARPKATGWRVIIAIFAVGFTFVAGLYVTAWMSVPADYRGAKPGVPARTLRLACRDFKFQPVDWRQATAELRGLDADFLLLTGLSRKDAHDLAAGAGMRHGNELQAFYSHGCAILARHRLHKGQVLAGSVEGACVVIAEPVIDGKRFALACVDVPPRSDDRSINVRDSRVAALVSSWKQAGSPPMIVGADQPGLSAAPLSEISPRFLASAEWRIIKVDRSVIELTAQ